MPPRRLPLFLVLFLFLVLPAHPESPAPALASPPTLPAPVPPSTSTAAPSAALPVSTPTPTTLADPLLRDALAAETRFDSPAALHLFLQLDAAHPNDPFLLQKIARQYSDLVLDAPDAATQQHLCTESLAWAQRAFALAPRDPVNVLSLAIAYGKLGLHLDTHTRVEYSRLVRTYAEQALALDPDYAYAHHVLGRWHYEVATLGATKRFLVRLVYGGLPAASTTEAVRHLHRAVELSPRAPAHRVELGFALLADGQRDAARAAFAAALALPPLEKYDQDALRRARAALAGLR